MKSLLLGIVLIVILGFGGLVYRNAVEHPNRPIACPIDALICPDGTSVARTGLSCTFAACPEPNVTFANVGIAFAVPVGFASTELPDAASVAAYEKSLNASTSPSSIIIRRYPIISGATALSTIQQTAIGAPSGIIVPSTAFSSTVLGERRFTVVAIERFEGVIDTAYYLARTTDVLRFDAIDREVAGWMNANLDIVSLPTDNALRKLLTNLQVD